MDAWRARDRASQKVVLVATDCTEHEFIAALADEYGVTWVYGTPGVKSRFSIERFEIPDTATKGEIIAALQEGLEACPTN